MIFVAAREPRRRGEEHQNRAARDRADVPAALQPSLNRALDLEASTRAIAMIVLIYLFMGEFRLETHGPLGTLLGISFRPLAFYIALIWLNSSSAFS